MLAVLAISFAPFMQSVSVPLTAHSTHAWDSGIVLSPRELCPPGHYSPVNIVFTSELCPHLVNNVPPHWHTYKASGKRNGCVWPVLYMKILAGTLFTSDLNIAPTANHM